MSKLKTVGLLALLAPLIVSYDSKRSLLNPVDEIGAAVASASETITGNLRAGRHLGFDTYAYPGDNAMLAWKQDGAPYEWVGYYLPSAPCHKGDTWSGKRQKLTDMGWGLAVIYVGQQVWSGVPRQKIVQTRYITKRVKQVRRVKGRRLAHYVTTKIPVKVVTYARAEPGQSCSTHLVSADRGTRDASDAIATAATEGFAHNTVIFLDIERMDTVPAAMRDYYKAWTRRVLADGRYRPGYYAHDFNAKLIYRDVASVFVDAGRLDQPPFWIASGRGFSEDKQPHEVGHEFAQVWQGILDVVQTHNGVRLPIDVNVASGSSPSAGD